MVPILRRKVSHLSDLDNTLISSGEIISVSVGPSPFDYYPPRSGMLFVSGGNVSSIEYMRNGVSIPLGMVFGQLVVEKGDFIRISHLVAPTVNFAPFSIK